MIVQKPKWMRKRLPIDSATQRTEQNLRRNRLHTICQEACCPNQGECFSQNTASFLIMGNICTRNCLFCAVQSGKPGPLDGNEPERVAEAVQNMHLRYVVITSVTRDDLPDGGAEHFAKTIRAIRKTSPKALIEVLIPDFNGLSHPLKIVIEAMPDVLNHNIETVARCYPAIRPRADYNQSIKLLKTVKEAGTSMLVTKSGIMVGMGETLHEVENVMQDLRFAGCDILTIGQYLRPSENHYPVFEYINQGRFDSYEETALRMGFKAVVAAPFVRSSYLAEKSFQKVHSLNG